MFRANGILCLLELQLRWNEAEMTIFRVNLPRYQVHRNDKC